MGATFLENKVLTKMISGTGAKVKSANGTFTVSSIIITPTITSKLENKSGKAWATSTSICRVSLTIRLMSWPVCLS